MGFLVKLQRFRAVFAVFDREPTDTMTGQESSTYPCVGSLLASFCSNRTSASAAKASKISCDLNYRGKGFCQPIQPAAERLIAGQLLELAQMVCSDEIVDTLPRQ